METEEGIFWTWSIGRVIVPNVGICQGARDAFGNFKR